MDDRLGESRHREEREREAQWRSVGSSPRIESPLNIEIESNRVELGAIENETRRGDGTLRTYFGKNRWYLEMRRTCTGLCTYCA